VSVLRRPPSIRLSIREELDVVIARAKVRELAACEGCADGAADALATATSEVARNIIVHARFGELCLDVVQEPHGRAIVIVARDTGPGIADLEQAMQDGYTTARGLGLGLSSARRLVDDFDVISAPDRGTTVTLKKWVPRTTN